MFTRKLTVIVVPLLMCAGVCLMLDLLGGAGFFYYVMAGLVLGILLSLVLPITGATAQRERFGTLLWVPTAILTVVVVCQFMLTQGLQLPGLAFMAIDQPSKVLVECAFIGFMMTTCFRTKVY